MPFALNFEFMLFRRTNLKSIVSWGETPFCRHESISYRDSLFKCKALLSISFLPLEKNLLKMTLVDDLAKALVLILLNTLEGLGDSQDNEA